MNFNLDDIINHRIAMLAILLKRQVFKIIATNNLSITPDQWVILYYLWQENGLSIGEIASRSKKDFANVTRIVDKLNEMGYVTKRKSRKDARSVNVFTLPKADEIRTDIQNCWKESSDIALSEISESEQQYFLEILMKIENNVLKSMNS